MFYSVSIILVIESDHDFRVTLASALRNESHTPLVASNAASGWDMLKRGQVDLVIMERVLGEHDGIEILQRMKADPSLKETPVLIVSHQCRQSDRIEGLTAGADDYICKPVDRQEVVLRAKIALRRTSSHEGSGRRIELKGLSVEASPDRVVVDNSEITLTPTEFRLLLLLVDRPNKVQSRQSLLAEVWGMQSYLETRTVDMHIRRLRRKLGTAAHHIETVRGAGYRFSVSEPALEDNQQ